MARRQTEGPSAGAQRSRRKVFATSSAIVVQPAVLLSEETIRASCVDMLAADGWENLRTDPVSDKSRAKGFGTKGMADDQFIRYRQNTTGRRRTEPEDAVVELIWIEWKKTLRDGTATKMTQHQRDWHRDARIRGAVTFVAGEDFPATIDGFLAWYRASRFWRARMVERNGTAT